MRIMLVDDLLFLNEKKNLFWHKMRLKMHFCCLKGLCANFVNFRSQKAFLWKLYGQNVILGRLENKDIILKRFTVEKVFWKSSGVNLIFGQV